VGLPKATVQTLCCSVRTHFSKFSLKKSVAAFDLDASAVRPDAASGVLNSSIIRFSEAYLKRLKGCLFVRINEYHINSSVLREGV
jgi:hypothetical protein